LVSRLNGEENWLFLYFVYEGGIYGHKGQKPENSIKQGLCGSVTSHLAQKLPQS
jgi:hypothetical protein